MDAMGLPNCPRPGLTHITSAALPSRTLAENSRLTDTSGSGQRGLPVPQISKNAPPL